jgi:glycosyltransferase involved in cell wall biosynthesis
MGCQQHLSTQFHELSAFLVPCTIIFDMKLSVVIITFNEERNLQRCLESVKDVASEIIVLDSFSTDSTREIAEKYRATFVQHAFDGHIQQKNRAWKLASHEWVLSLDADEALDEELQQSIRRAVEENNAHVDGFTMNRLTNYCGTFIHHSGWYPDTKLRLFRKGKGEWGGVNPHDKFEVFSQKTQHLKGDILHYSYYTREDHLKQIEYFSGIASRELYQRGKKVGWVHIVGKVIFQYLKNILLRRGFLDGSAGFTIARLSAYATWRKYTKLKELYREG